MISTVEATPNIAVVKYWGKRDEKLILPTNASISATMDETLRTRTSVVFSERFKSDEAWLNGKKLEGKDLGEISRMLDIIRSAGKAKMKARMASLNCFPTAAGFASSASGMAALACAGTAALGLEISPKELSIIARQGSGSACRSVMGGFVEWTRGEKKDGSDYHAVQIADEKHWPQIRNVIAITEKTKKKVSSRAGMKQTVDTSSLFAKRIADLPNVLDAMRKAIRARDLESFLGIAMKESTNMHAVMMDTWPPIIYLNNVSREIIYAVHDYNAAKGALEAGYTFDAGPNAHVYTTEKNAAEVRKMLGEIEGVQKTMVCRVGSGPKYLKNGKDALFEEDGTAKKHYYDEEKDRIVIG